MVGNQLKSYFTIILSLEYRSIYMNVSQYLPTPFISAIMQILETLQNIDYRKSAFTSNVETLKCFHSGRFMEVLS